MKILVMSDSHGNTDAAVCTVRRTSPALILHLGDNIGDTNAIADTFPKIPLRAVAGNCDYYGGPERDEFVLEDMRFFMTHGHLYGVKSGFDTIINSACNLRADILLFGHTHKPYYEKRRLFDIPPYDMIILNPGSIGSPNRSGKKTYAVLEIENGVVHCVFSEITGD